MATKEKYAAGIVKLGELRDAAVQSGDQAVIATLDAQLETLSSAYRQLQSESTTEISDSVDTQARAVEYLHTGGYRVPPNKNQVGFGFSDRGEAGMGFPGAGYMNLAPLKDAETTKTTKEILEIEKPLVLKALAEATDINKGYIDITSGLPGLKRFRMGALRDESQIYNYLIDEYGQNGGEVRKISMEGSPEFLVQHPDKTNGQYVLADEYGPSLKDVLDISREAMVSTAEVGSTLIGPGKASITLSALKTGLGTVLSNLAIDTLIGNPDADENDLSQNIGNALTEGGKTTLMDLGIGVGVKTGIRILGRGQLKVDEQADKLMESRRRLERKFNMKFPETFATREGTMEALEQQEEIVSKYSNGFMAGLARKAERTRDIIYDLSRQLTQLPTKDFGTLYRSFRNNQISRTQQTVLEVTRNDQIIGRALNEAINSRIQRLGYSKSLSSSDTGNIIRNAFIASKKTAKKESDRLYDAVFDMADSLGVTLNPSAVSQNIENVVNSLDLPKDLKGEVLNIFKPKGLNKVSRQAGALGEEITEDLPIIYGAGGDIAAGGQVSESAVQNLSLRQLDNWRKEVSEVIGRQIKQGKDVSQLKKVQSSIEGMIDEAMETGGDDLVRAAADAKLFFTESVVPFRAKGIADLSTRGKAQEYTLGNQQVINKFFNGPRAVENLQELKRVIGNDAPALENMRSAYIHNMMDKGMTYNGNIDYLKLQQVAFDKNIVRELYGEQAVKGFDELDQLMRLNGGTEITQDIIESMTKARTPADIKAILDLTSEQIRKNNLLKLNSEKLIGKIRSGDISMEDPRDLIVAVRGLKAGEAKEFINALPNTGGIRQSFVQEYLNDLMTIAGRGSSASQKTSRMMGGRDIWDYKLMDKILGDKKLRANYEAILGKNTLNDLADLNNVLKSYSRRKAPQSKLFGVIRKGSEGQGIVSGTIYGSFDYIRLRVLSAAFSSGSLNKVLSKARNEDDLFKKLLPTMLGTTRGVEALTYEADKDPRFQLFLNNYISNSYEN